MQVVRKTGLVPIRNLVTGAIRGVAPGTARDLLSKGQAELVPIPAEMETYEDAGPPPPPPPAAIPTGEVEIPGNWDRMHFLKQIKLAQELRGYTDPPEGRKAAEYAREVIREEILRRAATEPPAG